MKKENGKVIISEKPLKTWAEIFKEFEGDPGFSVHRELLKDKPRSFFSFIKLQARSLIPDPCLNTRRVQRIQQAKEGGKAEQQFNAGEFPEKAAQQGYKHADHMVDGNTC
jgi:hypothetical protein